MTTVQSGSQRPGQRSKRSVWRRPAIPRAQTACSTEGKNKTNSTLEIMVKVELNTQDIVNV